MTCTDKFSPVNGRACTCSCSIEEEQMEKPMNTPVVSSSQPISKHHCNDIGNNEISILIIITHLYLYN